MARRRRGEGLSLRSFEAVKRSAPIPLATGGLVLVMVAMIAACSARGTDTVTATSGPVASVTRPTPSPNASWSRDTGVNNDPAKVSHQEYCENSYGDPYRGGWVAVCAGGKQDGATGSWRFVQGAIWVDYSPDPRQSGPESSPPIGNQTDNEYDAPNSPTWVKIIGVNGDIVTLQREDGSTLTFSLVTKRYS